MHARARLLAIGAGIVCLLVAAYLGVHLWPRIEERRLLGRLDEGSEEECAEAIEALLARGPAVFPAIIECLETGSNKRQLWCLVAVEDARMQDILPPHLLDEVGNAVVRCARDGSPEVREQVVQVGSFVSLLPSFRGLLESADDDVRITGYRILWESVDHSEEPPRDIEPLLPIVFTGLKDKNQVVRVSAALVLGKCDWVAAAAVPALMAAYAREAVLGSAAAGPPPEGLEDLAEGLVPSLFLQALGDLGPLARPAVPLLIQVIETRPSAPEVGAAFHALTAIRFIGKEGMTALEAASTGEPEIQRSAQSALEEVSAEEER